MSGTLLDLCHDSIQTAIYKLIDHELLDPLEHLLTVSVDELMPLLSELGLPEGPALTLRLQQLRLARVGRLAAMEYHAHLARLVSSEHIHAGNN